MPNIPIQHADHQDTDHETLSALFDGQLEGDQARFALKRLGHDPQWRRTCGDWQLAGDVLRGNAGAVAPPDFAARVMVAVARESRETAPAASRQSVAPVAVANARRRWVGGAALAASVAMAALFVVRPLSQTATPMLDTPAQQVAAGSESVDRPAGVGAGGVLSAPRLQVASVPQVPLPHDPITADPASPVDGAQLAAAAAIAVAELPRRAGERRSRGQSQRAAGRGVTRATQAPVLAAATSASRVSDTAVADTAGTSVRPFQLHGEIVSRPWPRAALADYPAARGALTASYGSGEVLDSPSPSFYPFEPQALQAEAPRSDWPQSSDWP